MKKLNKNNNGFSVMEVLLVIVTLAIIGLAGYFVAKHVDKNLPVSNSSSSSSVSSYTGWHKATDFGLSFMYPPNWVVSAMPNPSETSNGFIVVTKTAASNLPAAKYSNDLALTFSVNNTLIALLPNTKLQSYEKIVQPITVNSVKYDLVENDPYNQTLDLTNIDLESCSSNSSCVSSIKLNNKQSFGASITSDGNYFLLPRTDNILPVGGTKIYTINTNSSDYNNILLILQSLKF